MKIHEVSNEEVAKKIWDTCGHLASIATDISYGKTYGKRAAGRIMMQYEELLTLFHSINNIIPK